MRPHALPPLLLLSLAATGCPPLSTPIPPGLIKPVASTEPGTGEGKEEAREGKAGQDTDEQLFHAAMDAKDPKVRVVKLEKLYARQTEPEKKNFVGEKLVEAYAEVGDIEKMEAVEKETTLEEEDYFGTSSVQNAMAYAYAEKGAKLDLARDLVMSALSKLDKWENGPPPPEVDPEKFSAFVEENRGYFLDTLGWIDHKLGHEKDAVAVLQEAARRTDHSTIRFHLGTALVAAGDPVAAAATFARGVVLEGDDVERCRSELLRLEKEGKGIDSKALLAEAKKTRDAELAKQKAEAEAESAREKEKRQARLEKQKDEARKDALSDRMEREVPKFQVAELEGGRKIDNDGLKKTVTLIDFWASWCAPCRLEMPMIQDLYEKYKGKVRFVAISVDDKKDDAVDFLKENPGFHFPVAFDDGPVARSFRVTGLPTLLVIGPCGNVNWEHRGFNQADEVILPEQIDTLLREVGQSCDTVKHSEGHSPQPEPDEEEQ